MANVNDPNSKLSKVYAYTIKFGGDTIFHNVSLDKREIIKYVEGKHFVVTREKKLLNEFSSVNGKLNGAYIKYFENGQIEMKGEYEKGYKRGIWLYYDEQGKVLKEEEYSPSK